jgi:deazaflavin-dependent oxidoreductase (nitroreductase family)
VGGRVADMPVLRLTTYGRKTGEPHTVLLTAPLRAGDELVVVASRGGDDHSPAWYLNIERNPIVDVELAGGRRQQMRARVASEGERTDLWPRVTRVHPGYADYQEKTTRQIPLVLLRALEPT